MNRPYPLNLSLLEKLYVEVARLASLILQTRLRVISVVCSI
jgi:hypothetical protein